MWVLGTYFVFMFFPLVFEVTKEGMYKEMEKLQIRELKEQGASHQDLRNMGFSKEAVEGLSVLENLE